jgi:hypothetical protein
MKNMHRIMLVTTTITLMSWPLASPTLARAQAVGNDAVYPTSGICCKASSAFIDASMFLPPNSTTLGRDVCDAIYRLLTGFLGFPPYPAAGAVIDARGVSGTTNLTCTHGSPWTEGSNTVTLPSTILLPATGGASPTPIIISNPWVLPPYTHLIGEGDGIPSSGSSPGTTIQVSGTFPLPGPMIQFGSSSGATGISVENLTLDGEGGSLNGIMNQDAGNNSYVDHVSLYRILGTGLSVSGNANNSGPYSNITFDLGGHSGTSLTYCASINGLSGTQGIHGLTCISENNDPQAAVLLDSSNNSIEDVRIAGFFDGILVGSQANAKSNVLININGDTTPPSGPTPVNTVHISSNHTVTDLSITGISNLPGTYTIQDDVTGPHLLDSTVGIYALGEKDQTTGAYSRFTTSPNVATWAVGSSAPQNNCAQGSLYSCIGGGTNCISGSTSYALWACALNGSGSVQWLPVQ